MKISSEIEHLFTNNHDETKLPFTRDNIKEATNSTNQYLDRLPSFFGNTVHGFYSTLNQRNLSGFIGEVFKHALHEANNKLVPNPHPDGRPDVLDISKAATENYFSSCFDNQTNAPIRSKFAPFKHGGVEIKCTIGNTTNASQYDIGDSRIEKITRLNYWAHHAHECDLLGIYYDYCQKNNSSPQIKAAIFCKILEEDWHKVSVGRPDRKKTSNTSLNKQGVAKLKKSLLMHTNEDNYIENLRRIKYL